MLIPSFRAAVAGAASSLPASTHLLAGDARARLVYIDEYGYPSPPLNAPGIALNGCIDDDLVVVLELELSTL